MLLFLLISGLKISLIPEKDTFYVAEPIRGSWKIVNEGDQEVFIQRDGYEYIGLLSDNCRMWDSNGKEIPHTKLQMIRGLKQGEKYHIPVKPLSPNDTIVEGPINLLLSFHNNKDIHGLADFYLTEGEYYYCLYYWIKEGEKYRKVYSDTFHFWVIFPTGEDRKAFKIYRRFSQCYWDIIEKRPDAFKYGYKILKKFPNSVYAQSVLFDIMNFLRVNYKYPAGTEKVERVLNEMMPIVKDIDQFLEDNIKTYFPENQVLALKCIVYGELTLGKTKEEVKGIVERLGIKGDKEITTLLEIK